MDFFGGKEALEESNEPSLIKVHWLAHFLFLCSGKQLSIPVYVVLSPIVQSQFRVAFEFISFAFFKWKGFSILFFIKMDQSQRVFSFLAHVSKSF